MNSPNVGAQLYIFQKKHSLAQEMEPILASLAGIGYTCIEGFYRGKQNFRDALDRCHLTYAAAHLVTSELSEPGEVADYVLQMGGRDVCVSGPIVWNERTPEDYRKTADFLNRASASLHSQGVTLNYHNHDFEFLPLENGETGMEILLQRLDFRTVKLCLDAGWVWRAESDPAAFLETHAEKIGVLHLRDFRGENSVPLGEGGLDQRTILAVIPALLSLRHVIVEQDPDAENPALAMKTSFDFLKGLLEKKP